MNIRPYCAKLTQVFGMTMLLAHHAVAVSSFETNATRDTNSGIASDPQGPAAIGSLLSEVIVPSSDGVDISFLGSANARAAADDTGAGAAAIDGTFFTGNLANSLTALSVVTSEFTNTTGGQRPFSYDFFLPGPRLTLSDGAGIADTSTPTIRVFYDFRVSMDLGSGFVPRIVSQGELQGGRISHTIGTSGTNPLASTFFGSGGTFGYQFDDFADSITGLVADGDAVAIEASLFVRLDTPAFETGGAASIGDPLDLSVDRFSSSLNIIPIPAAVWLMGVSLIGLLGAARRKSR